jgi:terminase large subunit-like protein
LRQQGLSTLTRCDSKEEKIVRMSTASNMIENGQVYLPEKAPWLSQYVHELVTFPNGKHYDQVDSTSQALRWFKSRAFLSGIQQYYKEEATIANYKRGLIKKEDVPEHLWKRLDEPPPPPRRGPFGPCW